MTTRRFAAALALVALAAAAGRVAYVLTVTRHDRGLYDAAFYELAARRLVEGGGFTNPYPFAADPGPAADHPPLTQVVLVPAAWPGGGDEPIRLRMRFTMVLLGTATVVVVGLVGRAVRDEQTGLVAAGIAAVNPSLWMNDGLIMSETPATLTAAGLVGLAVMLRHRLRLGTAAAAGALAGLAALTRAELAVLFPALVLPAILAGPDRPRRWRAAGAAVAAAGVVVAPWVAFNLTRFEEPTLLSTGDGLVLRGANCDRAYFGEALGAWSVFCVLESLPIDPRSGYRVDLDEQSVSARRLRDEGLAYLGDHLGRLPVVVAARVGRLWSVFGVPQTAAAEAEGRPGWATWTGAAFTWVTVPLAVAGAVVLHRERRVLWPLAVPVAAVTVLAAVFYGTARFRAPAEPSLAVLAAVAVTSGMRARRPDAAGGAQAGASASASASASSASASS